MFQFLNVNEHVASLVCVYLIYHRLETDAPRSVVEFEPECGRSVTVQLYTDNPIGS